jgi:alkylation response protein AidB-like acyl-CoA dehydrogenase
MGRLWEAADEVDRPGALPVIEAFDAYRQRQNRVRLAPGIATLWDATFGAGLGAPAADPVADSARLAKVFLMSELGELGTICPMACTDGMVRVLEKYPSYPGNAALSRVRGNAPGRVTTGAQFVTEIHAGSDAARVTLDAHPAGAGGAVTLEGAKWFCSNVTADYWIVLARQGDLPQLVLVDRAAAQAAGKIRVERLKDKLGTRALATAEVTFDGAPGWQVGEPGRGLAIVVGVVLTTSRVWTAFGSASYAVFAARAARAYAQFRSAFGRKLAELPLVAAEVERLERAAAEVLAGALGTVGRWLDGQRDDPKTVASRALRLCVLLAKRRVSQRATQIVHDSMMVLGGNGIEERFSPLPRLLRDAVINETWEGPHTLLVAQAHKDLQAWHAARERGDVLDALLAGRAGARGLRDATLALLAAPASAAFAAQCDALFDAVSATELQLA